MDQQPIDIESIVARRKAQWMKGAKQTISIQERIATSLPWWLIIIFVGALALSAGHTAGLFNQLSPVGYAGPFVVEVALLWAAFVRTSAKQDMGRISMALRVLEAIAFVMAIGANGIGAMTRVAMLSGISALSFDKIIQQFPTLPITTQSEILAVPLFGLFIPIITWVAGEGMADLFLKQRQTGGLLEEKWREVEREELRRAFYTELINRGHTLVDARRQAETLSAGFTRGHTRTVSAPAEPAQIEALVERPKVAAAVVRRPVQIPPKVSTTNNVRADIRRYLETHPESVDLSTRKLSEVVTGSTRSYQVASEELKAFKARQEQRRA